MIFEGTRRRMFVLSLFPNLSHSNTVFPFIFPSVVCKRRKNRARTHGCVATSFRRARWLNTVEHVPHILFGAEPREPCTHSLEQRLILIGFYDYVFTSPFQGKSRYGSRTYSWGVANPAGVGVCAAGAPASGVWPLHVHHADAYICILWCKQHNVARVRFKEERKKPRIHPPPPPPTPLPPLSLFATSLLRFLLFVIQA